MVVGRGCARALTPPAKGINMLRVSVLSLCLLVMTASSSTAEQYEYKDYEVRKGDTLWDISSMHLKDPFQWPVLWRENRRINNPDRIYPGQRIRIPVAVIKQAVEQVVKKPVPVPVPMPEKKEPVVRKPVVQKIEPVRIRESIPREVLLASGYISREVPYEGEITGSPTGKNMFAKTDEIYLRSVKPAAKGDRFYVIRKETEVKHPLTGEWLGYLIKVLAVVEVEKVRDTHTEARVVELLDVIYTGDMLERFYEILPPILTGPPRKPAVQGTVVATNHMKVLNSKLDIIYIDRGSEDGLEAGDMLITVMPGTSARPNGLIQVINLKDTTSSALVINSKSQVGTGDIVSPVQPY